MDNSTAAANSTDKMPSLAELKKIVDVARRMKPADATDLCLMTEGAAKKLREEMDERNGPETMPTLEWYTGIPCEIYPTARQCIERAIELRGSGKRVAVISE